MPATKPTDLRTDLHEAEERLLRAPRKGIRDLTTLLQKSDAKAGSKAPALGAKAAGRRERRAHDSAGGAVVGDLASMRLRANVPELRGAARRVVWNLGTDNGDRTNQKVSRQP
jgi:hypothetical protein